MKKQSGIRPQYRSAATYRHAIITVSLLPVLGLALAACGSNVRETPPVRDVTVLTKPGDLAARPHAREDDGFPNINIQGTPVRDQIQPEERENIVHELNSKRNRRAAPVVTSPPGEAERIRLRVKQRQLEVLETLETKQ